MTAPFPHDPTELRRDDLTRLVRSLHPQLEVVGFDVVENKTFAAGTDEVSTAGRIIVDVAVTGEGTDAIDRRWVIKVCRPDLGDIPLYENEAAFYTRLRPELEIEAPACFGGLYETVGAGFGIALEDLRRRDAHFANVKSDVPLAQIESLLSSLAALHARYWESPRFDTDLAWVQPHTSGAIYTMFNHPEAVPGMIAENVETYQLKKKELVEARNWLHGAYLPESCVSVVTKTPLELPSRHERMDDSWIVNSISGGTSNEVDAPSRDFGRSGSTPAEHPSRVRGHHHRSRCGSCRDVLLQPDEPLSELCRQSVFGPGLPVLPPRRF